MGQWNGPLGDVEVIQWLGNREATTQWAAGHGVSEALAWGPDNEDGTPGRDLSVPYGGKEEDHANGVVKHGDFLVLATDRSNPDSPVTKLVSVPQAEFMANYKPRQPSGGV